MPTKKILISGTRLTYKIITPDIKRKQNKIFYNFWNIGLVLVTLINWLLKPKCMLIHIFLKFSLLYENTIWFFYFWETWPYAWKQNIFYVLTKKKDILIPDLYLYSIKIQTNIDQNAVKYLRKITDFFEINFEFFFLGLAPARPMWLGWTQQAPAGPVTRLTFKRKRATARM